MIPLRRLRDKLPSGLCGERLVDKGVQLLRNQAGEPLPVRPGYWQSAKKNLVREAAELCIYCQSRVGLTTSGVVDHFRPRSPYWWLTYCYDNLVFACDNCNSTKGNAFPIRGSRQLPPELDAQSFPEIASAMAPDPSVEPRSHIEAWLSEEPVLINPYYQDPSDLLSWNVDHFLEEVEVEARDSRLITTLGLNRELLKKARYRVVNRLKHYRRLFSRLNDGELSTDAVMEIMRHVSNEDNDEQLLGVLNEMDREPQIRLGIQLFARKIAQMLWPNYPYCGMVRSLLVQEPFPFPRFDVLFISGSHSNWTDSLFQELLRLGILPWRSQFVKSLSWNQILLRPEMQFRALVLMVEPGSNPTSRVDELTSLFEQQNRPVFRVLAPSLKRKPKALAYISDVDMRKGEDDFLEMLNNLCWSD